MSSQKLTDDAFYQVKLHTKQVEYAVPDVPHMVPSNVTVDGLNELIRGLLKENPEQKKLKLHEKRFDFVINGELLRLNLQDFVKTAKISTENDILVEYFEAAEAPEPRDILRHKDWVACCRMSNKWILSGCYDNTLWIWSKEGKCVLCKPIHNGPVKDVAWIDENENCPTFVSVSHDQTAMIWRWDIEKNELDRLFTCRGHTRSVHCVGVNISKTFFATGDFGSGIKIWTVGEDPSLEELQKMNGVKKKPRLYVGGPHVKLPRATVTGHREAVSSIQWITDDELLTSSFDHTMKIFDVEYGGVKTEYITDRAVYHASYSPLNNMIVTCGADRCIRLYDRQGTEDNIVKKRFTSHKEWVEMVRWSPQSPYYFVSAGYDKEVKIWDTRCTNTPLYNMSGHTEKVFCCDWSNDNIIASGSADYTLRLLNFK